VCVDKVIPETAWDQKVRDVVENNIDVFVMGNDWEGKFDFLKEHCEVIYLPRTEGVSTTELKAFIHATPKVMQPFNRSGTRNA
jgi:glycerol-3-phosphate cytidylyltransferase